jgi:hypothetical protein
VELGIPSKELASYRGYVARDMRATPEASRTGRRPREGARNMKATSRTLLIALAMATILATVTTGAAVAGKGGGGHKPGTGAGGSISLVLLNSTDGWPHVGQEVTFNVSTTATSYPWVTLYCYQSGNLVYKGSNGIFPTSLDQIFTLASNSWTSGDADCTAWLQDWDNYAKHGWVQNLASMDFHVYA